MFLVRKLKKWIELEIKELKEYQEGWERSDCKDSAYACRQQIEALENVQFILENKRVWNQFRTHGIFKEQGKRK